MKHPECPDGYIYFENLTDSDFERGVGWKTKRKGNTAYNPKGEVIPDLRPCFVQISEIQMTADKWEEAGKLSEAQEMRDLIQSEGPVMEILHPDLY